LPKKERPASPRRLGGRRLAARISTTGRIRPSRKKTFNPGGKGEKPEWPKQKSEKER